MKRLSKSEKLLLAAVDLYAENKLTFSAEDLIVKAHQKYEGEFCLKGYPEYPHSNSVLTQLMGKKAPLIIKGWLQKAGTNKYRVTDSGLDEAGRLRENGGMTESSRTISRDLEDSLGKVLTSDAYRLFIQDRKEEITFHLFCRFVGLSVRDRWQKVEGRLQQMEHLVDLARETASRGETLRIHFRQRNYAFDPRDLFELGEAKNYMLSRFSDEMQEWKRNASATAAGTD